MIVYCVFTEAGSNQYESQQLVEICLSNQGAVEAIRERKAEFGGEYEIREWHVWGTPG